MNEQKLVLVDPTVELRAAYVSMLDDFRAAGEPFHGFEQDEARGEFAAFVQRLNDSACGVGLPEGLVPQTHYWLVRDGVVLGTVRLRHRLTPHLVSYGGHIGYDSRPSARGNGYATWLLVAALEKARALGLQGVLVTCDTDNPASTRVIEKNGGVFRDASPATDDEKETARYWIDLRHRKETARG